MALGFNFFFLSGLRRLYLTGLAAGSLFIAVDLGQGQVFPFLKRLVLPKSGNKPSPGGAH
ncbi:hypothetical protein IE077_001762 [Cardiosporidium cionae]|uniref:Uncharacterized protein n=1 Tax=Cardiosporidium cionae TaxID=476202 RepID=A0ABQ7JCD4_9APIC|nr:hypothetical protein IE077_001762 [Cardiosporidium cionae]|eukprot:KAF8821660.1 hypothetical protein IE077_001762 [Cardiosporidium cionae]